MLFVLASLIAINVVAGNYHNQTLPSFAGGRGGRGEGGGGLVPEQKHVHTFLIDNWRQSLLMTHYNNKHAHHKQKWKKQTRHWLEVYSKDRYTLNAQRKGQMIKC